METDPNDKCHCGSGKKYKQCCLSKDHAEALAKMPPAPEPPPAMPPIEPAKFYTPEIPIGPARQAANERWQQFETADYESRIAIFNQTLNAPEIMDDDMAFEMLDAVYDEAREKGEHQRYASLVSALRKKHPRVYKRDAHYYLSNLITNALVTGQREDLPRHCDELSSIAGRDLDIFVRVLDMLSYHGELALVISMMRKAWSDVVESDDLDDWAVDQFGETRLILALLSYVENTSSPSATDPDLLESVRDLDVLPSRLAPALDVFTGKLQGEYTLGEIEADLTDGGTGVGDSEVLANEDDWRPRSWNLLQFEFISYLHSEEDVSYAKAELGRRQIADYLASRYGGDLDDEIGGGRSRFRKKVKNAPGAGVNLLCPDGHTLDFYLGSMLDMLNYLPYRAAATFEIIPGWLRFLESKTLITPEEREQTLSELEPLHQQLLIYWERASENPLLLQNATLWLDNPGAGVTV